MEITINDNHYRIGRMNAITQFNVLRRLTPCLTCLTSLASNDIKLEFDENNNATNINGDLNAVLAPLGSAIAALGDEDVAYIFNACLEIAERKQTGGTWAPVRKNGVTMFDGLSLPTLLQLTYHVLRQDMADFFKELPSLSALRNMAKL